VNLGEYILSLLAIISALSVGELVAGFHFLLLNRKRIKWDWLPLLVAIRVLVLVLYAFWVSWSSWSDLKGEVVFGLFLLPVGQLTFLYFAARSVLPNALPEGEATLDLGEYYRETRALVWGSLALNLSLILLAILISKTDTWVGVGMPIVLFGLSLDLLLAIVGQRWVHRIVVPPAFVILILSVAPSTIS
jgi:hypothetical protein